MASTWALILFYNPAPSYGSLLLAGQAEGAFTVKMLLTVNAIFEYFVASGSISLQPRVGAYMLRQSS